jgi:hypothetical protein
MRNTAHQTRQNRTITVDFQNETTSFQLLGDGTALVELVPAFILSMGFQLKKATCRGGRWLTRHSHDVRVRLGGVTLWRLRCIACNAVFTVLPHVVWRYRPMHPGVARDALVATHDLGVRTPACGGRTDPMRSPTTVGVSAPQSVVQ